MKAEGGSSILYWIYLMELKIVLSEKENFFFFLVGVVCIFTVELGQFGVKNNVTHMVLLQNGWYLIEFFTFGVFLEWKWIVIC